MKLWHFVNEPCTETITELKWFFFMFRQYIFYARKNGINFSIGAVTVDPMSSGYDPRPLIPYMEQLGRMLDLLYHVLRISWLNYTYIFSIFNLFSLNIHFRCLNIYISYIYIRYWYQDIRIDPICRDRTLPAAV